MDENYFYSLIKRQQGTKKRICLKCQRKFISKDSGHRICGACKSLISTQGALAELALSDSQYALLNDVI